MPWECLAELHRNPLQMCKWSVALSGTAYGALHVAVWSVANTNTNTVGLKPSSPALASEQICSWGFAQSVGTCPLRIRLGDRNHPHKYVNSSTR